jgi:hypothetical protein
MNRLEKNIGALSLELTLDDLKEKIQGSRYPEELKKDRPLNLFELSPELI